jgi:hypothetical protein
MTKISQYSLDNNIGGNDKWIGSDAQNFLMTKNFTPNNVANYFNSNNVIDIGTSIRYRYQTLDPGEVREQGTISFETEVGPQVNFSDITTFLIAKNTLKGNTVTDYLDFLVDGKVLLSKASNINIFGYYKITSIESYLPNPNFFIVVVEFLDGNGFIYEDLDYLISLVDKVQDIPPTVWGSITGDIEDQTDLINYISSELVPYFLTPTGTISEYVRGDGSLATFPSLPTRTSDLVNDGQDGIHPFLSVLDLPSNLILFPTTTSADVSGYFKLVTSLDDPDYDEPAVDVSTGAITTTGQLIASLVTVPNLINGNPGVFNVSTYGNIRRTSGSGTAEFYFEIYQRNLAGTETLIGTSGTTAPVNTGVYTQFSESALWNNGVFLDTDRIVLKFYANRIAGASNPTYDFQFGGNEPVRTLVPIPLSVLPSQIPTLQQVVEEGRTFTESDGTTQYDFETFTGSGVSKVFRAIVTTVASGLQSILSFSRNAFTLRVRNNINPATFNEITASGGNFDFVTQNGTTARNTLRIPTKSISGDAIYTFKSDRLAGTYNILIESVAVNVDTVAIDNTNYIAASPSTNITFTDPSPTGSFYTVLVRNSGTATVGGVAYPSGTYLLRHRTIDPSSQWNTMVLNNAIPQTVSFTAINDLVYTTNGTLTVTDPTPVTNKGYIVHVIGGTATIGGVGYTTGALVYRYYDGSSWISTNMNNAITIDANPTDGSSNAVSSNGVFDGLTTKLNIEAAATTGVLISFTTDRVYGTIASPETGNITADVTGGLLGVTNIIIHNAGSAPTFGAEFKKLSGSGNYVASVVNYIYCTYITSTEIIYSINQRT